MHSSGTHSSPAMKLRAQRQALLQPDKKMPGFSPGRDGSGTRPHTPRSHTDPLCLRDVELLLVQGGIALHDHRALGQLFHLG